MKLRAILLGINALMFVVFGVAFIFVPAAATPLFLGVPAPGGDLLVDIRATYGGLSLAVGILMAWCAYRREFLHLGLLLAFLIGLGLFVGRAVGILEETAVGQAMYQSLGLELFLSVLFGWALLTRAGR